MVSFKKLKSRHKFIFALIVGLGVVLFWRGIWMIADVLIFPDNYLFSGVVSFALGSIILLITGLLVKELI